MTLDFGYTSTIQGVILSSFFFGYLTTQVLGGVLADKYGGKWVLGTAAALWSLFTFLTPISAKVGLEYLILCRVLLGVSEGASFPSLNSVIAAWFPTEEISKAVSAILSSSYLGVVIAWPISTWLGSGPFGWPSIFWTFGLIGLVWSILWQIYAKSSPNEYLGISQEELDFILKSKQKNRSNENLNYHRIESNEIVVDSAINESNNVNLSGSLTNLVSEEDNEIGSETDALLPNNLALSNPKEIPWKFILSRHEVWAILIAQFCNTFGNSILFNWLPIYFLDHFKLNPKDFGYYSMIPYATQGTFGIIVGVICDYLINKLNFSVRTVRRSAQIIGAVGTSIFLLSAAYLAQTPMQGIILISIGTALNSFFLCGVHISQLDIAPRYAGAIYGLGNTCAGTLAVLGVAFTGWVLDVTNRNWNIIWILITAFYTVGTIFFVNWVGHKVIID
ncbi:46545_t:CDS:2 [Gigaspora margarita]|uniref:46545_t:CDS:1 n=1 Tax=Gigaspora margarita TaxID=4874 RepID=A0ABN7VMA1_GIGMA|nr:46545_t:CDS:2 [Gigaspora margarita]